MKDLVTVQMTREELESLPIQLQRRISRRWKKRLADIESFVDSRLVEINKMNTKRKVEA